MEIIITKSYEKKVINFLKLHPTILNKYKKTLLQLSIDPFHPALRTHKLIGNLSALYSVSINMQYRILMYFIIENDKIILIDIGDHDHLYR